MRSWNCARQCYALGCFKNQLITLFECLNINTLFTQVAVIRIEVLIIMHTIWFPIEVLLIVHTGWVFVPASLVH